jgi:phenylalanyl-tRNA synthetase alpha subunit
MLFYPSVRSITITESISIKKAIIANNMSANKKTIRVVQNTAVYAQPEQPTSLVEQLLDTLAGEPLPAAPAATKTRRATNKVADVADVADTEQTTNLPQPAINRRQKTHTKADIEAAATTKPRQTIQIAPENQHLLKNTKAQLLDICTQLNINNVKSKTKPQIITLIINAGEPTVPPATPSLNSQDTQIQLSQPWLSPNPINQNSQDLIVELSQSHQIESHIDSDEIDVVLVHINGKPFYQDPITKQLFNTTTLAPIA